jgi:puromycin-sensitive aminopeptidase
MSKKPFVRLPTNVVPVNYALELKPDLEKFTFLGKVDITLKVNTPTKTIVLNAIEITIDSVTCGGENAAVSYDEENQTATFEFPREITSDSGPVHIEYSGLLNNQMRGFYRSKYQSPSGVDKYGAVTQFEAADARRALPCWDEPAHKATFDVTLVVPKDLVALSNMDVKSTTEVDGGLKSVVFNRTPIMSTYLLAFVVGEYDYIEEKDSNGVLVRVYTPVGKKEQGRFALNIAVKTIPFYTEYFKIPYPLPKIDLIAIADFAAGAMENWGLVTYRERILLVEDKSPVTTKQIVAIVVGHELAHQWFGNLVTMEWWTDLWLNEGFASWIEYLCVDYCHPEYEIWTQFLAQDYSHALSLDALANSHPIEVEVGPPSEVEEIFDAISYSKGASVIRMLHNWIGDDDFRKGMNLYLTKYQYKNTVTNDLWASLGEASGKPVTSVMETWTKQMGYPVLTVDTKQDGNKRQVTISQKKFCADGNIKGYEDRLWKVPVTIATERNPQAYKFVLDQPSMTIALDDINSDEWIKVNPGQYGFYRVNYSSAAFAPLLNALSTGSSGISAQDRLGLINDAFALARSGDGSTVEVLKLFKSFVNEDSLIVWQSLVSNLTIVNRLASYSDFSEKFRAFAQSLFSNVAGRLGWEPKDTDSPLDTMLRSLVLKQYCDYGNQEAIQEARRRFDAHIANSAPVPSDLREVVFGTCMANGSDETFDQLVKVSQLTRCNAV